MLKAVDTGKWLYYLDNLKICLTLLVILHHVGQAYGPTGGFWQYKSSLNEIIPWLGSFFTVNASFFMGLFFMIAGYFLPGSYERKSVSEFIKNKLIKYGVPILFVFFILQPLQMYFYYNLYSGNSRLDFFSYLTNIYFGIGGRPVAFIETIGWPEMNFGHLWFVEHLLVYSLIYLVVGKVLAKQKTQITASKFGLLSIVTLGFIIAVTSKIIRIWYPIDKWIAILGFIQSEVAHLPQYLILFVTGIVAYQKGWFEGVSKRVGIICLTAGIIMALLLYARYIWPVYLRPLINTRWALYESLMAVFLCWGLIVLFRERFNKANIFTEFLAENSYAAYIFHFPVVLAVQYAFDKIIIFGALGKFIIVSVISIVVTYFVSYSLRRIPLVKKVI